MISTRPYEFKKGDRRFSSCDYARALRHANAQALKTGRRQQVRSISIGYLGNLWLVREVDS